MRAIVIGKFYPFHNGHSYLIDQAEKNSDELTVLVCDSPHYTIPARIRASWIRAIHPGVNVEIIPDIDDDDNSQAWAEHTLKHLSYTPDYVFSSESYGIEYAKYMGATHIMVDLARTHVPISGTKVRNDIENEWPYLHETVKAHLALRVVIVGAESTGTTTLANEIAQALAYPWIPEYGRMYSEAMMRAAHHWTDGEFIHIASQQQAMEHYIARQSQGIIVCDTNATATQLWQQRYLNHVSNEVNAIARKDIADLYIITGDEIDFVQDGTRDGEHIRRAMHEEFVSYFTNQGSVPAIIVRGNREERLAKALRAIDTIRQSSWITSQVRYQHL